MLELKILQEIRSKQKIQTRFIVHFKCAHLEGARG